MSAAIYILVMAGVTYLIRAIPFTLFREEIRFPFFKSFLYYVPYAVLTAMTIPASFFETCDVISGVAGTIVALVLAYFEVPLIGVALAASGAALAAELLLKYLG